MLNILTGYAYWNLFCKKKLKQSKIHNQHKETQSNGSPKFVWDIL